MVVTCDSRPVALVGLGCCFKPKAAGIVGHFMGLLQTKSHVKHGWLPLSVESCCACELQQVASQHAARTQQPIKAARHYSLIDQPFQQRSVLVSVDCCSGSV